MIKLIKSWVDSRKASVISLIGMISFMVTSQVMFKLAGNYSIGKGDIISSLVLNPWLWIGLLSSIGGMGCWLLVLRKLSLASAYPWTALVYVLTPLASALLFGEILTGKYLLGLVCIVAGVYVTSNGVKTE